MRIAALALVCAATLTVPAAHAAPGRFGNIIAFGDSLSDVGSAQLGSLANGLPDPTPASVGFFNGRFSNGPIYLDLLHDQLAAGGGPSLPFAPRFLPPPFNLLPNGENFAVGGARAAANLGDVIPDFELQRALYALDRAARGLAPIDPDALYVISLGNNDARAIANGSADAPTPGEAAEAIRDGLAELLFGGARRILFMNVGDLGLSPVFNGGGEGAATDASIDVNAAIDDIVFGGARPATGTQLLGGFAFTFFDFFAWTQAVAADPVAFGLPLDIELETPCFVAATVDPTVLPGCDGFAWSDAIHPSSSVHAALAASLLPLLQQQLVPAPAMVALFGLGVLGVASLRRRTA